MFYFAGLLSRTSYESTKTLIGIDFSNTDFNNKLQEFSLLCRW